MATDNKTKADVKKATAARGKLKTIIGGIAILAVAALAGLVYSRYEAGISPDPSASVTPSHRLIHVTVPEQNLAVRMGDIPGASRPAAVYGPNARPNDRPMANHGPWCGLDQRGQT